MEHVRFPLLSREYLVQRVDNTGDDLFNRHPVCKDYVIEALKFHLLTATMPSSSSKCLAAASGMVHLSAYDWKIAQILIGITRN